MAAKVALVDFRILGPVEIIGDDGERVVLRQQLQRRLVAELLVHVGQPRSPTDLIAALWDAAPPSGNGRTALRSLVHGTRRALGPYSDRIETWPTGYVLRAQDGESDLNEFRDLAGRGQSALDSGDPVQGERLLGAALRMWRDPAIPDLPRSQSRVRLTEEYRTARSNLVEARLALGQHNSVLADLRAIVFEDHLHEHSWAQLMIALYRSGSRAEALACYREVQKLLAAGHGLDPGPELTDLHARILSDDPRLLTCHTPSAADWPWVPLRQLPAPLRDLTGRQTEATTLLSKLSAGPPVVVVRGMPGTGKTALAVHVAHLAVSSFPDGQIWVDLNGSKDPRDPQDVLGQLIVWALGHPVDHVPPPGPEREALYRSLLAGRRVLVVADGAEFGAQVRPLLPGTGGSSVLVTTCCRLHLEGAEVIDLPGLSTADALELLAATAGRDRVAADMTAAESIVKSCGNLPLAVRIAAWQLTSGRRSTLAELARALAQPDTCMTELTFGDHSVSGRLHARARLLDPFTRDALQVLASRTSGSGDLPPDTVTALLGEDGLTAAARLADVRLLTETRNDKGSTTYHLHRLVRLFALTGGKAGRTVASVEATGHQNDGLTR